MLCPEFPPVGGGAAHVVQGLTQELARQGHRVDVLTMRWRHRNRALTPACLIEVPCIRRHKTRTSIWELMLYLVHLMFRAAVQLRRRRYDICHAHFILPDGIAAALICWWRGLRLVITAHGSDVPGYNPDRFRLLHRLLQPVWRRVVRSADAIVCPSPTLERLVKAWAPAAPTMVVPNGFNVARFVTERPRARRILVVSRLVARKGIDQVIAAYHRLDTDFELHIVGDGPMLSDLQALAAKGGRPIRFWGGSTTTIPACAIFTRPRRYSH